MKYTVMLVIAILPLVLLSCSAQPKAEDTSARRKAADVFRITASNSFVAGNYDAAVTNLTAQLALYAGDYNAYHNRARAKYWLHDYAGAVADYDKAIFLNPQCGGFYCNRGQSKFALNDVTGALADYNKAIELDPNMAVAYFNRGVLTYCASQNFTNAVADFTKAIELHTDPQEDDIFVARAKARMQLKDFAGAVSDLKKAIELNPGNQQARINLMIAQKAIEVSNTKP